MHKTVVIDVVGLTPALIGDYTPNLKALRDRGQLASIGGVLPAVTTTVQSTYLTGCTPARHGIVGNGWYFRDECEVKFWRQSNRLVEREKVWEQARRLDPSFSVANCFWWYAMYSSADVAVTPRPMYPSDGRKLPDVWTHPPELRQSLQRELGQFPLFKFWGPATSIQASDWIARSAVRVAEQSDPTLLLIYLPHLDYVLQKQGPDATDTGVQKDLREVDALCGTLLERFADRRVIVLSEYGIVPVSRPVDLNRVLRRAGLITVRDERGHELLDAGASAAFAVTDHQLAHVYVNDPSKLALVRKLVEETPGVGVVLDEQGKREAGLDHPRSGELVALAESDAWFTYYYWLDDARAPDFARTVDIHRKPGYDPAELFIDPAIAWPMGKIAWTLARRKLGMRALMAVTPLHAEMVRGSHGLMPASADEGPVLITNQKGMLETDKVPSTGVCQVMLDHLTR